MTELLHTAQQRDRQRLALERILALATEQPMSRSEWQQLVARNEVLAEIRKAAQEALGYEISLEAKGKPW